MNTFKTGCIFDPEGHLISGAHIPFGMAPEVTNDERSLSEFAPGEGEQADTGSCTGWASAGAAQTTLYKGEAGRWLLSPQGNYGLGRCIDRADLRQRLTDDGAMPNQVARGMYEWGLPLMKDWPFNPEDINAEPTEIQIRHASGIKLKKPAYRINEQPNRDFDAFRRRLAQLTDAGISCMFSTAVDQKHMDYDGSGIITTPNGNLGGHMLQHTGYQKKGNVLEWKGSWSKRWGRKGYGYGDEGFISQTRDWLFFVG